MAPTQKPEEPHLYRMPGGFVKIVIARYDGGALGGRVPAHTLSPCLVDSHHGGGGDSA
jgi:hypothetical protein